MVLLDSLNKRLENRIDSVLSVWPVKSFENKIDPIPMPNENQNYAHKIAQLNHDITEKTSTNVIDLFTDRFCDSSEAECAIENSQANCSETKSC